MTSERPPPHSAESENPIKPPQLDIEKYRPLVSEFEIGEEEQSALLESLWHIMKSFVDMGFGVDSIQILFPEIFENSSDCVDEMLSLTHPNNIDHELEAVMRSAEKEDSK